MHDTTDCRCPGCIYRGFVDAGLTVDQLPKEYQTVPVMKALELRFTNPQAAKNMAHRLMVLNVN